ncbi:MAG TPA: hypothetical protein VMZ92_15845 [Planctomycetota bacterium]|nr:hypothetical protein [Planctomycetota bacterium]
MRDVKTKTWKAFTLLEVLLAAVLVGVMLAVGITFLRAGMGASSRTMTQGVVQERVRQVVEVMVRELKDTGETCTGWTVGENPDPADQYYGQDVAVISFSRCVGYDPALELLQWGPVVTYEYEPPVGEEPGKLVRTEDGTRVNVCDNVSAFTVCYVQEDSAMTVTLTVECADPGNAEHTIRVSYTTNVNLRN